MAKQKIKLCSTTAELISLTEAVKKGNWIRKLLKEIEQEIKDPIILYEDN